MKNAIAWFEIPTTQLDRAQAFYEAVLGQPMRRENMGPSEGAVFAYDPDADGAGGALMMGPTAPQVSGSGTLVYLDASPSLDAALEQLPFIPRISASRQLQMQVEAAARLLDQAFAGSLSEGVGSSSERAARARKCWNSSCISHRERAVASAFMSIGMSRSARVGTASKPGTGESR